MAEKEKLFKVVVITPMGIVYSHNSSYLQIEAIDGGRGFLYNHAPLITPLGIGEVRVRRKHAMNDRIDLLAVNGGYIEFLNNKATIIADSAERERNIDIKRAESARERAQKMLAEATKKHDKVTVQRAQIALRRALNRINVYNDRNN